MTAWGQTNWTYMHKVKKHETIYGIAKTYGVTEEQLRKANPIMNAPGYELRAGDRILVPAPQEDPTGTSTGTGTLTGTGTTTTTTGTETTTTKPATGLGASVDRSNIQSRAIRVGVMLPIHNNDGDGKRMVEYYRGILMALDKLKADNISVDIHTWNVPADADIRATLSESDAANRDIIFGPLYTSMVKPLADFCQNNNIKLVIPFSIEGDWASQYTNVYQVYQSDANLTKSMVNAFFERYKGWHPIFIDCNDDHSTKGAFTAELKKQLEKANISYNITSVNTPNADFAKAFRSGQPNVVVLNSASSPALTAVYKKMETLPTEANSQMISMFGYNEWFMYTGINTSNYHKYNTYIPTYYYYNPNSASTKQFEKDYETKYGTTLMKDWLPRFALTGYDHANFFLRGLHEKGFAFTGAKGEIAYKHLQTPLRFQKASNAGGMQNKTFMLIHYLPNKTLESVSY